MIEIVIDGNELTTERAIHEHIASAFDFGPPYGHNLDALWDFARGANQEPVTIRWINTDWSRRHLGHHAFARFSKTLRDLAEATASYDAPITYEREIPETAYFDYPWENAMAREDRTSGELRTFVKFYGAEESEVPISHRIYREAAIEGQIIDEATYNAGKPRPS